MIGRVAALWRYPVKSMAGQALERADVAWQGIAGDRRWAFVQDGQVRSGFPYFTIRERSEMARFVPSLRDPSDPDGSSVDVRTPSGEVLDVADPALAAALGGGIRPIKLNRGLFDAAPLSLATTQAVAQVSESVGTSLDPRRFRPNLLVDTGGEAGWPEDAWIGSVLRVGDLRFRVDRPDKRCVVVTVDPETTERDPRVLRAIAQGHDACFGVYGTTVAPGALAVGDPVFLEPAPR